MLVMKTMPVLCYVIQEKNLKYVNEMKYAVILRENLKGGWSRLLWKNFAYNLR